jgi:hypothetical protein
VYRERGRDREKELKTEITKFPTKSVANRFSSIVFVRYTNYFEVNDEVNYF